MSKTVYATANPAATGDGSTPAVRAPIGKAITALRDGDTLSLQGGQTYTATIQTPHLNGLRIIADGGRATIDAAYGIGLQGMTGAIEVAGIDIIDSSRDPSRPGFTPHVGGMGFFLRDSPKAILDLHDCSFRFHAIGIDLESVGAAQSTIKDCLIGPTYGINQRSQGIYAAGQSGTVSGCVFDRCGWWPKIAPAINQNHGIYWHWDAANAGGPLLVTDSTFLTCAAAGPTCNTDGTFTRNLIVDCAQDGSGMLAWGSRDCWTFADNLVAGGFVSAIAKSATVTGNVFAGANFAVNIGVPGGQTAWRSGANIVAVRDNALYGTITPLVYVVPGTPGTIIAPPASNRSQLSPDAGTLFRDMAQQRLAAIKSRFGIA